MAQQITQENHEMLECALACTNARRTVEHTLVYCLRQGGDHVTPGHVQLMRDCIDICDACAAACDRLSGNSETICRAAAEITRVCAEDCEGFQGDDTMLACAVACRRASKACARVMA